MKIDMKWSVSSKDVAQGANEELKALAGRWNEPVRVSILQPARVCCGLVSELIFEEEPPSNVDEYDQFSHIGTSF